MARAIDPDVQDGLERGSTQRRDLIWITVRDRSTGDPQSFGYWSGVGTRLIEVVEPEGLTTVQRSFTGAGTLISMTPPSLVLNLTVQECVIDLSAVSENVALAIRDYDPQQAPIEVYRLDFDIEKQVPLAPADCLFFGFVDETPITTPEEGGEGSATLRCLSHTQELYRVSHETRSHESQLKRASGDRFYEYAGVMHRREVFWGENESVKRGE